MFLIYSTFLFLYSHQISFSQLPEEPERFCDWPQKVAKIVRCGEFLRKSGSPTCKGGLICVVRQSLDYLQRFFFAKRGAISCNS